MQNNQRLFFQILLIVLALAFTLAIRYMVSERCVEAGGFGDNGNYRSITVSEAFNSMSGKSR